MIKVKLAIIVLIILYSSTLVNAQFKKIEFASFDANSPRTKQKDKVEIFAYSKIETNGLTYVLHNNEETGTLRHYKYQMDSNQLLKIKSFFNPENALKDYLVSKSLKSGQHFAGSYNFLLITYLDGKKDSLCFIEDLMSSEFKEYFKLLESIFYKRKSKKDITDQFLIPAEFKKSVQASYKKSYYLPAIEFPPPAM